MVTVGNNYTESDDMKILFNCGARVGQGQAIETDHNIKTIYIYYILKITVVMVPFFIMYLDHTFRKIFCKVDQRSIDRND